jgi:2-dehydropantoate 2-reductase
VLLTLENGLGSDEFLAQHFGGERVIGGLCFICVNRVAPAQVQCFEPGTISIAEYGRPISERLRTIADLFNHAGVRCTVGDNLSELRWKKLVWNVPFNGLSIAAGGVPTDRILASAELEAEARGLMREVIAAAAKFGYTISESFIDKQIDSTRPMGPYKPSSLIDYLAGRDVEVEAIWGEPVRRARAAAASIPKMEMLYALLKQLCAQKRA